MRAIRGDRPSGRSLSFWGGASLPACYATPVAGRSRQRVHSKAAGKMSENRRPCRSAPTGNLTRQPHWGCRNRVAEARSDPAIIHPRGAALYKLGKGRCQRVHSKAAGTCRITGGFALAPQTSTWGDVSLGRSNRSAEVTMHFVPADCQGGGRPVRPRNHTPALPTAATFFAASDMCVRSMLPADCSSTDQGGGKR